MDQYGQFENSFNSAGRHRGPSWIVPVVLILLIGAASAGVLIFYNQRSYEQNKAAAAAVEYLQTSAPLAAPAPLYQELPLWLVVLVAGFLILQVVPLLAAYLKSKAEVIEPAEMRKIGFLCEVPIYLGLLGSLLGVCATQFTTGSLAAPLAYLTSITGIVLYLFGRFSISLTLPLDD